jgi:hypothetical protein
MLQGAECGQPEPTARHNRSPTVSIAKNRNLTNNPLFPIVGVLACLSIYPEISYSGASPSASCHSFPGRCPPLAEAVLVDREHQPRTSFVHDHGEVDGWTVSAPDGTDGKWSGRSEGVSPRGVRCGRSPRDRNGSVLIRCARYEGRERIADIYRSGGARRSRS